MRLENSIARVLTIIVLACLPRIALSAGFHAPASDHCKPLQSETQILRLIAGDTGILKSQSGNSAEFVAGSRFRQTIFQGQQAYSVTAPGKSAPSGVIFCGCQSGGLGGASDSCKASVSGLNVTCGPDPNSAAPCSGTCLPYIVPPTPSRPTN